LNRLLIIIFLLIALTPSVFSQGARRKAVRVPPQPASGEKSPASRRELADASKQARDNLVSATQNYRASLEKLLALYSNEETRAAELVEKRRKLLDLGVIAKREVQESEQKLSEVRSKTEEVRKQISEADHMLAEVVAAEENEKKLAKAGDTSGLYRPNVVLIRYSGLTNWSLADAGKVQNFFQAKFGRPLPLSAWGQTATHDRLGFDHHNAMDVAVHPDSVEGRALMDYLRSEGIPFIAFRAPVAGSATGVHIHIGSPSHRISLKL